MSVLAVTVQDQPGTKDLHRPPALSCLQAVLRTMWRLQRLMTKQLCTCMAAMRSQTLVWRLARWTRQRYALAASLLFTLLRCEACTRHTVTCATRQMWQLLPAEHVQHQPLLLLSCRYAEGCTAGSEHICSRLGHIYVSMCVRASHSLTCNSSLCLT